MHEAEASRESPLKPARESDFIAKVVYWLVRDVQVLQVELEVLVFGELHRLIFIVLPRRIVPFHASRRGAQP